MDPGCHVCKNNRAHGPAEFWPGKSLLERSGCLFHFVSQATAQLGRVFSSLAALRIDLHFRISCQHQGHFQLAGDFPYLIQEWSLRRRRPVGVTEAGPGRNVQQGGTIADRSRYRMAHRQAIPQLKRPRTPRGTGEGRLEPEQSAAGGGNPNRSSSVAEHWPWVRSPPLPLPPIRLKNLPLSDPDPRDFA